MLGFAPRKTTFETIVPKIAQKDWRAVDIGMYIKARGLSRSSILGMVGDLEYGVLYGETGSPPFSDKFIEPLLKYRGISSDDLGIRASYFAFFAAEARVHRLPLLLPSLLEVRLVNDSNQEYPEDELESLRRTAQGIGVISELEEKNYWLAE